MLAPNVTDYLPFLYTVVGIPPANLPSGIGTATSGTTTTLTDTTQAWTANQWAGSVLSDTTQGVNAQVVSNTTDALTFAALSLPVNSGDAYVVAPPIVSASLAIALEIVNEMLTCSPTMYTLAVYNLAADRLINFAPDVPNQTYFLDLRKGLRINEISVGVPSAASDQGTATGILNPEFMKTMTLADLQTLRTPFGRTYMGIALSIGTLWGLS
jgi:hypothetical protein